MEELDKELFSSTLKTKSMASTRSNELDFDEEDPLKDLLSSSGENTPVRKTSLQKNATDLPRQQSKSKLIADLFGLNDQEEVKPVFASTDQLQSSSPSVVNKTENPSDWLGLKAEPDIDLNETSDLKSEKTVSSTTRLQDSTSKRDIAEVDILPASLTRERSKIENFTQASASLTTHNDITTKASINTRNVQENRRTNAILNSFLSDYDSRPVVTSDSAETKRNDVDSEFERGKNNYTLSGSREPRRSIRRRGGDLVDPLGLFTSSENTKQADSSTVATIHHTKDEVKKSTISTGKSSETSDLVPSWLGGGTPLTSLTSAPANQTASTKNELSTAEADIPTQSELEILAGLATLETQAGEAATQQQKSLITALALKRQEDVLLKLQTQQAALLTQHEQQLGSLVQRQVQRQQQMIRQQEQIQAHIQALMVQPPVLTPITLPPPLWRMENESDSETQLAVNASKVQNTKDVATIIDLKEKIGKLEKENQDLKSLLDFEKQKYDSQLLDMENLFRKQLAIQEETLSRLENRLMLEKQAIENEAMIRLNRVKEEHSEATGHQAQRLAQLHGEWLADLQRLGEFHQQAVEMLRSEQTSAIEHWKNLQLAEIAAVQDASSNSKLLNEAVKNLKESAASVQELKYEIKKEYQANCSVKFDLLQKQEAQLAGLKEALEKQALALDTERTCLSTMTRDMESRLLRQQQEFDNQKNKFEARERAWEKEKTGAVELLTQEKKHLERLRLEVEGEVAELSERKLALATEVARLEATIHIQNANASRNSQNAEQMVAEARSTLEAAQEAGREVQREREEIMALKSCLNKEQKRLDNLEREIQAREARTEVDIMRAKALKEEGISALDEARRLERERTEHASDLAQRLLHLKEREDRLAEEKLSITLEWKRLQDTRDNSVACHNCDQIESTTLSRLMKSSENIVDPVPIIMKLEAEQGLDFITLDHPKHHSSFLESVSQ